jgi:hypothetical protein
VAVGGIRAKLRQEVATDSKALWTRIRKASRARAPDSPVPGEGRSPNSPARRRRADEDGECVLPVFGDHGEGRRDQLLEFEGQNGGAFGVFKAKRDGVIVAVNRSRDSDYPCETYLTSINTLKIS